MPSRPVVVLIVLFWLAVIGVVVFRDVLPRYFGDAPPAAAYGPDAELSQLSVEWTIHRGHPNKTDDEQIGRMTSVTEYRQADNTFRYENRYRGVKFTQYGMELHVPFATTSIRTDRDGRLKGQKMTGTAELESVRLLGAGQKLTATVEAEGVVRDGFLVGSATLTCPNLLSEPSVGTFTPVPVPDGQVLNPLMPLDRLRDVVPGRRWVVQQVDPLRDALGELLVKGLQEELARQGGGKKKPAPVTLPKPPELIAEVLTSPVALDRATGPVSCWVIEYTSADKTISARTYVRRDDGRVLRQEATSQGERLRFERAD
jgi:hypothetical protein